MKLIIFLFVIMAFTDCKKGSKVCYSCQQGYNIGGQPPRNFDTCFNSEEEYRNHRWVDANGNDLTMNCNRR